MKGTVLCILFFPALTFAQFSEQEQHQLDSLKAVVNNPSSHDTSLAGAYIELSNILYVSNLDTVIPLCLKAKEIVEKALSSDPTAPVASALRVSLAGALTNIGYIYHNQGDIPLGLEYYHEALKIDEELGNKKGMGYSYNNIGVIHDDQGDIPLALEYYHKSLQVRKEISDKKGIAYSYNNIGYVYQKQANLAKSSNEINKNDSLIALALEYFEKSLKIKEEISDKSGMAFAYNNIGSIYDDRGDFPRALEYYHKSLKIREEILDKRGMTYSLSNIGTLYLKSGDVPEGGTLILAREMGERGLKIARELGFPSNIQQNALLLSKVAKRERKWKEALEMYELHIQYRDSVLNEKNQKAAIRQQTKHEFEKAQLVKEQKEKEQARIEAEETSRRDNLQYSVILIALLVLFGGVMSLGFVKVSVRMAEGIIFFSFLILFEFLLVLADPHIEEWSGGAPGFKLLFNAGVAALIFPLHSLFESKLKGRLVKRK